VASGCGPLHGTRKLHGLPVITANLGRREIFSMTNGTVRKCKAYRHAALAGAALAHGPSVPLPGATITGLPANGGR
jgi:hypothetical protein